MTEHLNSVKNTIGEDFKLIRETALNDEVPVKKYKSQSCGLEIVHAQTNGPLIKTFIVVATKAEDELGLPHCLEHLIFMGSEKYPQNGTLRLLSHHCLANKATAWTDIDHTCFTITVAGPEGFCKVLPVVLDHIFHPVLSEKYFLTQVHHITKEGKDGGLIYSKTFAMEYSRVHQAFKEMMKVAYPIESGYHYNYSGSATDIRQFCTNEKVKEYHAKFYHPKNAQIIITGLVEKSELFECLKPIVQKFVEQNTSPVEWRKLWQGLVPPLTKPVEKTVFFPSTEEQEDDNLILIGFHGSNAAKDFEENYAIRILLEYLTDSSQSPLDVAFIKTENPIARNISFSTVESSRSLFYIRFEGISSQDKVKVVPTLRKVLQAQVSHFNLESMRTIIQRNYEDELSAAENIPHNSIAYLLITDFLYDSSDDGPADKKISKRMQTTAILSRFLQKPVEYWTEMLSKYAINQNLVVIYMVPSTEEHMKIKDEEENRKKLRINELGAKKLAEWDKKIQEAIAEASKEITDYAEISKIITDVEIPFTPTTMYYHAIDSFENPSFPAGIHCNFLLDDINSNFAYISVLLDTSSLSKEQRRYLPIFCASLTECAIKLDDGRTLPREKVMEELDQVFVSYTCGLGINGAENGLKCGSFSHLISFQAQLNVKKLGDGVHWLRRIFWNKKFEGVQIKTVIAKLASEIISMRRDGTTMAKTMLRNLIYSSDSNVFATSIFRQQVFLRELWSSIDVQENAEKVIKVLESIQDILNKPENNNIHVATSLNRAKHTFDHQLKKDDKMMVEWRAAISFNNQFPVKRFSKIKLSSKPDHEFLTRKKGPSSDLPTSVINGSPLESFSFLSQCIYAVSDFKDHELASLLVAVQYFCQNEGPFSRKIRSLGLCYEIFMEVKPNEGVLYLHLHRSQNIVQAYKIASTIVQEHLSDAHVWKLEWLTIAKNSLVFELIEGENTLLGLATTSLLSRYRNVPGPDQLKGRKIMKDITNVTLDQIKKITAKYIRKLMIEPAHCAIFCSSESTGHIVKEFELMGKPLTIIPSMSESFFAQW